MNVDSILNDMGMLIVSGMFKDVPETISTVVSSITAVFSSGSPSAQPEPSFVANSQASESYTPEEAGVARNAQK